MNQPTFLCQNLSQQLCCTYFQLFLYHQPLGNAVFKMLGLTSLSGSLAVFVLKINTALDFDKSYTETDIASHAHPSGCTN